MALFLPLIIQKLNFLILVKWNYQIKFFEEYSITM